jgi:hypothetical protein
MLDVKDGMLNVECRMLEVGFEHWNLKLKILSLSSPTAGILFKYEPGNVPEILFLKKPDPGEGGF